MRGRLIRSLVVVLACGVVVVAVAPLFGAQAATGSTLSLTGLAGGQSTVTNTFAATSFSIGIGNVTATGGGGAGTGRAVFDPVTVKHALKPAENLILDAATQGRHLPSAELIVRAGDVEVMRVTLTDVTIQKATVSGKSGQPEITLNYRQMEITIKDSAFCWDVAANAAC